jgi:hypothetical protein
MPAMFGLTMLSSTPQGDACAFVELGEMCRNTGFEGPKLVALEPMPQCLVVARKAF